MKFTVYTLDGTEVVSDRDDVTLKLSYDHIGVLRWEVICNSSNTVLARSCRLFYIEMNFSFTKGCR